MVQERGLEEERCPAADHRYFVAETVGVPAEGTVHVIALCTACGDTLLKSFTVAKPESELLLASEKQRQEK